MARNGITERGSRAKTHLREIVQNSLYKPPKNRPGIFICQILDTVPENRGDLRGGMYA